MFYKVVAVGESLLDWVRQVQKCRSDQYIIARKFRLTLNMLKLVVYNKKNNLSSQIDYPEEHSFLDECKVGDKLDCGQLARMHKALEKELHSMNANVHKSEIWFVKVVQHMVDLNSCNILWLLIDCYPIDRMPDENEKRKMINAACQREVTTHFDPNDPWIMLRLIAMDSSSLIPTLNEIMPLATWELKQFILNVMLNQQRPEIIEFLPLFIEAQQGGDAIAMALISFDLDEITPHVLSCKIENVGRLIHWFELQVSYVLDEKNAVHIRQKLNKLNHMLVNHPLTSKDMVLTVAEQTWGEFTDILYDVLDILSKTYNECFQIEKKTFIKEINFIKEYTFINVGKRMDYFFRQMLGDQTYVAWKRLICFSECSWINQRNSSNVLSLLNDQLMVLKYHVKESNMSIGIVAFSEKGAQFRCLLRSARVIELICNVNNWAYTLSCMKKIADLDCSKHDCFKYELSGSVLTELRLNVNDPSLELIIEMIYETLAKGLHFQLKDARDILNGYKDILPFDVDELLIRLVVHSNDIFSCLNVMNEMEHSPLIRSKNLFYIDALYSNDNDDAPVSGIVFQRWIYEQQATFRVFESKKDLNLFLNQFILFVCNHKQFGIIKYVINETLIPRLYTSEIIRCCTKEEIDEIKCRINIVLTNNGENTIEDIKTVYDALDLFIAEDIPKEVNVKKLAGWVVDRINNYSETQQVIFRTLKPFSCVIKSEKASIPHQYYITEYNQFKYAIYVMLGQNIEVPDHLLDSLVIRLMIAGIGLEMLYQGISPWFLAEDIIQWLKTMPRYESELHDMIDYLERYLHEKKIDHHTMAGIGTILLEQVKDDLCDLMALTGKKVNRNGFFLNAYDLHIKLPIGKSKLNPIWEELTNHKFQSWVTLDVCHQLIQDLDASKLSGSYWFNFLSLDGANTMHLRELNGLATAMKCMDYLMGGYSKLIKEAHEFANDYQRLAGQIMHLIMEHMPHQVPISAVPKKIETLDSAIIWSRMLFNLPKLNTPIGFRLFLLPYIKYALEETNLASTVKHLLGKYVTHSVRPAQWLKSVGFFIPNTSLDLHVPIPQGSYDRLNQLMNDSRYTLVHHQIADILQHEFSEEVSKQRGAYKDAMDQSWMEDSEPKLSKKGKRAAAQKKKQAVKNAMGIIIANAEKQIDLRYEAAAKERASVIQMRWKVARGILDSIIHESERVIENRRRQTRIDIFRNVRSVFDGSPHVEKIYVIGGLAMHLLDITNERVSGNAKLPEDWDFMVCEEEWEKWDEFQYNFLGPKKFDLKTTDGMGDRRIIGSVHALKNRRDEALSLSDGEDSDGSDVSKASTKSGGEQKVSATITVLKEPAFNGEKITDMRLTLSGQYCPQGPHDISKESKQFMIANNVSAAPLNHQAGFVGIWIRWARYFAQGQRVISKGDWDFILRSMNLRAVNLDGYVMKSIQNQLANHSCEQKKQFKLWVLYMCAVKGVVIKELFLNLSKTYPALEWDKYVESVNVMSHKFVVSKCIKALTGLNEGPVGELFSPYLDSEGFETLISKAPENIKKEMIWLRHRFNPV